MKEITITEYEAAIFRSFIQEKISDYSMAFISSDDEKMQTAYEGAVAFLETLDRLLAVRLGGEPR